MGEGTTGDAVTALDGTLFSPDGINDDIRPVLVSQVDAGTSVVCAVVTRG